MQATLSPADQAGEAALQAVRRAAASLKAGTAWMFDRAEIEARVALPLEWNADIRPLNDLWLNLEGLVRCSRGLCYGDTLASTGSISIERLVEAGPYTIMVHEVLTAVLATFGVAFLVKSDLRPANERELAALMREAKAVGDRADRLSMLFRKRDAGEDVGLEFLDTDGR